MLALKVPPSALATLRRASLELLKWQDRFASSAGRAGGQQTPAAAAAGLFRRTAQVDGVTIVSTPEAAERALAELRRRADRVHAWDTETADLATGSRKRMQSPVTDGYVVCATCYCGDDVDFGNGPRLFIDNTGAADGLFSAFFKEYFEEPTYRKVFHNYSFDRHALLRHGVRVAGFHADTLHLARLVDTSRAAWEGMLQAKIARERVESEQAEDLSLLSPGLGRAATEHARERSRDTNLFKMVTGVSLGGKCLDARLWATAQHMHTLAFNTAPDMGVPPDLRAIAGDDAAVAAAQAARGYALKNLAMSYGLVDEGDQRARSFRDCVGLSVATAAQEAHDSPEHFPTFVKYSTTDAVLTHRLFKHLEGELERRPWISEVFHPPMEAMLKDQEIVKQLKMKGGSRRVISASPEQRTMWDMVDVYVRDLGECLAEMEERGVPVDGDRLREIEQRASHDVEDSRRNAAQMLQSLRGPNGEAVNSQADHINFCSSTQVRVLLFGGTPNKEDPSVVLEEVRRVDIPRAQRQQEESAVAPVERQVELRSLGLRPGKFTPLGWPSTSQASLVWLLATESGDGDCRAAMQLRAAGYRPEDVEKAMCAIDRIAKMNKLKGSQEADEHRREAAEMLKAIRGPGGEVLNPDIGSFSLSTKNKDLQVLLFGGTPNQKDGRLLASSRCIQLPAVDTSPQLLPDAASAGRQFELHSLGLSPLNKIKDFTKGGWPSTSSEAIRTLVGSTAEGKGGESPMAKQMTVLGYKPEDVDLALGAFNNISRMKELKSRVSGFATPLLEWSSPTGRIHPSWAFDTSTGRLACRSPNLQNLPSVDRDPYKVRRAFRPTSGNAFVIADYAQLELCILAHMSGCTRMIEKLSKGGDYHSEVAVDMFPHIQAAIEKREVVITSSPDDPDIPTVKEVYSSERSKCKALNFGIVYGMTSTTLADNLNITVVDAAELMENWFAAKPMVRRWLFKIKNQALDEEKVVSLLGRWRNLPLTNSREAPWAKGKSVRAAQNFGIQGSAADVVLMAMLRLWKDKRLESLGFKLVMQVHDEFVLEGPAQHAEEARLIVSEVMEDPFKEISPGFKLKLPLRVDASVSASLGGS